MIPPLNFSSPANSSAKGGDSVFGGSSPDGGQMNVNYGNGASLGGSEGVPAMVWYAGLAIVGAILWKRFT